MIKTIGYTADGSHSDLKPHTIERAEPANNQVLIDILFCGVCHSDVHQVKNEWHNTFYPCMPGHEIIGRVVSVGADVKNFKVGDLAGVGCMIDSCQSCENCEAGLEQYCKKGPLATYNGNMKTPSKETLTFGGYSERIVVREEFVLHIPENIDPASAAPLLCAGVTTYSPMRHWKVGKNTQVGIIGLGGLGHIAVKIAKALEADVTVITSKAEKIADAKKLGASNVIVSTDEKAMEANKESLDFILSTIPQAHDANPYIELLKTNGVLTIVGCLVPLKKVVDMSKMIMNRRSLGSSVIGGIAETQEVLDFCGKHNIAADIQIIPIDDINEAFAKVDRGEVDFRYVIDMSSLAGKQAEPTLLDKMFKDK